MDVNAKTSATVDNVIQFNDLHFKNTSFGADYTSICTSKMTDRILHNVTACVESSILFAAREGWICSLAPKCMKQNCHQKDTTSFLTIKKKRTQYNKYEVQ